MRVRIGPAPSTIDRWFAAAPSHTHRAVLALYDMFLCLTLRHVIPFRSNKKAAPRQDCKNKERDIPARRLSVSVNGTPRMHGVSRRIMLIIRESIF